EMIVAIKELAENMKKNIDPNNPQPNNEEIQKLIKAQAVSIFYADLVKQHKDPAYYGKNVKVGDIEAVLMRWKISDNKYRVIFGDLAIEDVSFEELSELEAPAK
ncbi:MAG TPA: hypothetical protein PLP05_06480, partial [Sedimentisphaerales bacterium]|nr:hypothetical protein [Sedimentisphaerales bacterium]